MNVKTHLPTVSRGKIALGLLERYVDRLVWAPCWVDEVKQLLAEIRKKNYPET